MADQAPVLSYWERNPPFAAVAFAKLLGVPLEHTPDPKGTKSTVPALKFPSGYELAGAPASLRYFSRVAAAAGKNAMYGSDPLTAAQVDQWLDYSTQIQPGLGFEPACVAVNNYLALRTFLVDFAPSAADVAVWGALQGCPTWSKLKTSGGVPHLARWFDFFSDLPEVQAAVQELDWKKAKDAAAVEAGGKAKGDTGSFDIGLPNAHPGKVVTRFPPEPSGYLHIGHAKAALLNQYFAEMYKGRCLVRFDDTNPSKEKDEYVENIIEDMKTLGLDCSKITYTSDYFPQMLDLGERMIKAGMLYADDTPVDEMREQRMHGIESKRRNRPVEESLAVFKDMQAGSEEGLKSCIRVKMDMSALNKALRDPVAFRCNLTHHWRTGHTYKVYPTYDFACPFVDAFEGVTHALRTSEYRDREAQYYWILEAQQKLWPGLPSPHIWDYARLNFVYTVLSKRKLTWFVEQKLVDGWTDPRMPTVQGIMRRGMTLEALKEFIIGQGASKNVTTQEWDKIWTINKKIIDPVCPRHWAVEAQDAVRVTLTNGPAVPETSKVPRHKKYPPAGTKKLVKSSNLLIDQADGQAVQDGEEVTLMDWGNAWVRSIEKDASGLVTGITMELNPAGDPKKTRLKLTWLATSDELVPLTLTDFDYLITKKKVEEDDDFKQLVNPITKYETQALGDINMTCLAAGDVIQLERKGYFRVDVPASAGGPVVLFAIPDGHTKNLGIKNGSQ